MARKRQTSQRDPKNRYEPKWKTIEKVVALLEKSLAPEARVRHNVKLPCLSTGHEAQCDVVIEMGQEPRVMRTIVEVQKRNQQVKPNDFRGWCEKMRDVGASRLICVSSMPFPASIKDKAVKEYGPTVLLVRLQALETKEWPFQIVNNAMKVYKSEMKVDAAIKPNPLLIFSPDANPFKEYIGELFHNVDLPNVIQREGQTDLLPILDLVNDGIRLMNDHPSFQRLPEGNCTIPLEWNPKGVSFCFKERIAPIQTVRIVRIVYSVVTNSFHFPFEILSYAQEGHDKTLAWVIRATGRIDDKDAEFRFALVADSEGSFRMSIPQIFGIEEGCRFYMGYGVKATS